MPMQGQSIGKDLSVSLVFPTGLVTIDGITEYDLKPQTTELKHKSQNGTVKRATLPAGHILTVSLERVDNTLDDLAAMIEAAYFNGANLASVSALETIQESDGSVSQYQLEGGDVKFEDLGSWKGESFVPQKFDVFFSRRTKVS